MKRVAESQLTKDTVDDEDSTEPTIGIQKADSASLSDRKIRGLPKRALAPAAESTTPATGSSNDTTKKSPEPASRFGGFGGFGSSTPSAFTFTPPTTQPKTNATQTSQTTNTPSGNPPQVATSSQPPKGLSFVPPSNPTPPSTPPSSSITQAKRDAGHKYYLFLRGLNTSFLDAVTQAVQADPFVDIAEMLEKYKSLKSSALKDFNDSCSSLDSHQTSEVAPSSSKNPPSMPTPPKSLFVFGKDTGAGTASQSHATGFTPKLDTLQKDTPSPFTWSAKIGSSDKPASSGPSQPFLFGSEKPSSSEQTSTQLATPFGSSALISPTTDNTSLAKSKMTSTLDKASQGQDTLQGKGTTSSPFNFKSSAPTVPLTPGFSSFLNPSKPSDIGDTKPNASNPSSPTPSGFGFGTGKTSSVGNPFSFGKGSIGNPVGFAFGTPPAAPDAVKLADTNPSPEADSKLPSEGDAILSTPSQDPSPTPSQGSVYDADGPGEEDEITLHEGKAYAYKLASDGDKKTWVSVGKGQMKLKGRSDVKRRILMRNSNTGQVILNFNLFSGFTTNVSKRVVSFCVPGEDETATMYQLRVPNEADAVNWQKAIQQEVDSLLHARET